MKGIHNPKKKLTQTFDIKDLGELNHYFGIKITRSYESIKIDQSTYAGDVVKRFEHLLSSNLDKAYTTPMDRDTKITKVDFAEMTGKAS